MGYNTYYSLYVNGVEDENHEGEHELALSKMADHHVFEEDCRWYEHEADLREYSAKFPDLLFELRGVGEGILDAWTKYFKNGKMQHCPAKVTYDDFDESKLK